jgi:hypothetical protein
MKFRQELELLRREETEKKLKIAIFDKKIHEFNETIEKT